jgi:MFS family permease
VLGGTFVSGLSIVYEFSDAENRATYIGLGSTLPGISGALAPLIGGMLVGVISFQGMFLLSTCIAATSWALLRFTVREPRIELNKQPEFQRA